MPTNPILEEIYAAREKLLADAGGDLKRYLEGVRKREQASGRLRDQSLRPTIGNLPIAVQESAGDTTTLEDCSILAKLRETEE